MMMQHASLVIGWAPVSSKHMIGCVHRDSPETPQSTGFCCVALRASSIKECEDIVCRIGEASRLSDAVMCSHLCQTLNTCLLLLQPPASSIPNGLYDTISCEQPCAVNKTCVVTTQTSWLTAQQNYETHRLLLIKTFNRKTCDNIS